MLFQDFVREFVLPVPLLQLHFHEGGHRKIAVPVLEGNIRFRDPAFIEDRGNRSGRIEINRVSRTDPFSRSFF